MMDEGTKKHFTSFIDIILTLATMFVGVVGSTFLFRMAYEAAIFGWQSAGDVIFYLFG